jgi:putative CocE/NonD family hydrolase
LSLEVKQISIPMRDGVLLKGEIWHPSGPGPWPGLLMRQPYGHRLASTVVYAHPSWYALKGYIVFIQDVRGCGESEGEYQGFHQEINDGTDTVRALRSHRLCNGRVGSYGFSYQGLTQLLGESADASAPAMTGWDQRIHFACEGGAHIWANSLAWGLQLAAEQCRRNGYNDHWRMIRKSLQNGSYLEEGLDLLQITDSTNPVRAWFDLDPQAREHWPQQSPQQEVLQRPLLLTQGWHDPYLRGGLALWQQAKKAGGKPLLRIGPWSHLAWDRKVGGSNQGAAACGRVDDWQLAFFDHFLRDRPPAIETDPCMGFDLLSQQWRCRDPQQPSKWRWGLCSGGLAACRSDEGQLLNQEDGRGEVYWVHDPWRPVPGCGGHLGADAGLQERSSLDARADVVCFNSLPFQEAIELWGKPQLTVAVAADQPGFDLCVSLAVVRQQGSEVMVLSTGVLRQLGDHCLQLVPRRIQLQPLLASFKAGESLRLSIAAAAWPHISVNRGDNNWQPSPVGPGHLSIRLQMQLGGSALELLPMA